MCTWNRCELLEQTLEQMTHVAISQDVNWELLVVNNNSSDATEDVCAAFSARLPLRFVFESAPG